MSKFAIVSSDSHVIEPGNLWLDYTEAKFRDRAPKLEPDPEAVHPGEERFTCDGVPWYNPAKAVMAVEEDNRRTEREMTSTHASVLVEHIYPGAYDPDARILAMADEGVDAEVLYPTIGLVLYTVKDLELRHACLAAYNNWIADFCAKYPKVLKAVCMVDLEDVAWSVKEMSRCAKIGLKGAMVTNGPNNQDRWASPDLDPFWAAAQDMDFPVSLHVAAEEDEGNDSVVRRRATKWSRISELGLNRYLPVQRAMATLIFSGAFMRFPRLKVVSVEAEASWAISAIWHMDRIFIRQRSRMMKDYPIGSGTMLPSEYWRQNVFLTVLLDRATVAALPYIGADNVMWSSDYPHPDGSFPGSVKYLDEMFGTASPQDREKIVAGNCERLYGF